MAHFALCFYSFAYLCFDSECTSLLDAGSYSQLKLEAEEVGLVFHSTHENEVGFL